MVLLAKRLPVAPVPEKFRVATVRDDMIHHRGLHELSFLAALDTQRMRLKILLTRLPPFVSVASVFCRSCMQRPVLVTVFLSCRHQGCTASVLAGYVRFVWHGLHPYCSQINLTLFMMKSPLTATQSYSILKSPTAERIFCTLNPITLAREAFLVS